MNRRGPLLACGEESAPGANPEAADEVGRMRDFLVAAGPRPGVSRSRFTTFPPQDAATTKENTSKAIESRIN